MSNRRSGVEEQAVEWLVRLRDPAFADWDSFTAWLETDATHAEVYEALALADEQVATLFPRPDQP